MQTLLDSVDFRNPARARDDIARLGGRIPERITTRIQLLLASVPDPDEALHFLERLRHDSPAAFDRISSSPAALRYLITTFSYSRFLSEALLRRPEYLLQLVNAGDLHRVLTAEEFADRLRDFRTREAPELPPAVALARFRRRQLLRIVLRDVLGIAGLPEVTGELSNLADAILDYAYHEIRDQLIARHGEPSFVDDDGQRRTCGFAVIALGKLGGQELNYSSDIDLIFVYSANGETPGPVPISNKEFFKKVANQYTELLSTYTADGMCYRVDLRLRPDGRLGEIAISLDGAKNYYRERARDWEKQMLIKARVCAGNRDAGRELLDFVEPLIYSTTLDFRAVEAVSEARERIGEKLAAKRNAHTGVDVKLAPGGIRDIEFLVQCLQRLHGGREVWVRHGGTLFALSRVHDKNLLSESEYSRLVSAYQFLRNLEHRLQFDDDRQTHTLPTGPEELAVLARKMPTESGENLTAESLEVRLEQHLSNVRELYDRVIHAQRPIYYTPVESSAADHQLAPEPDLSTPATSNLTRYLDERAPQVGATLARINPHRGRERLEHYLEKMFADPERLSRLDADPRLVESVVDIFEHSQYFGDQLLRHPEMLDELAPATRPKDEPIDDSASLRSYFRRKMLQIESASMLGPAPIFETLEQTSALADEVVAAAYGIALQQAPPPNAGYTPTNQMMVIALGRLGMREFDLASDADLVFVIPDEDVPQHGFWTAVAERMINTISAYTGDGVMFTVDTRLRPNGREGALVQSEGAYREYFAKHAEAWEGIAYMKSRAVAGDLERATEFLHKLQELDWRRYGQSGRSRKELAQMRARLEKEQGARNPLKTALGGYYDIDFALMYLRLKGAGIFYKVLNTPARIDVVEQMGHLDREDADFLRDAAVFYRAIDHGLRVSSGYAGCDLPTSPAQSEVLTELVRRWTPAHLQDRPLQAQLAEIRQKTREFFNRVFGG
jgi:glutamate-ammonia-ligase adenylyltransferase